MSHRETALHRSAFETFYASDRSFAKTGESCGVAEQSVRNWAERFHWHARADARDQEAAKKAEKQAIARRAKTLQEHMRLGELMRRRSEQHFQKHEIESTADAIRAGKEGILIERQAEGLPAILLEILSYDEDELRAERQRILSSAAADPDRPFALPEGGPAPEEDAA